MIRAVLDTSVLVKSIFKPLRSLSAESYSRELQTHEKCVALIKLIEERDVEVLVLFHPSSALKFYEKFGFRFWTKSQSRMFLNLRDVAEQMRMNESLD